jgi:hypothetical protein
VGVKSINTVITGQADFQPALIQIVTNDTLATVTTAGYLNSQLLSSIVPGGASTFSNYQMALVYTTDANSVILSVSVASDGTITLSSPTGSGESFASILVGDGTVSAPSIAFTNETNTGFYRVGSHDIGIVVNGIKVSDITASGYNVAYSTSSATPGTIRALKGVITGTATTMTSGTLTGVRGEVDMVGASGGFAYGVQGKVIPTGTLSGSIWAPAVFGQYDLSAATLNAGQIAAIWGDMGATGGTFTDVTGARMFAGTNTIASLTLNSMVYLYGKATNLFELSGSSSTYISATGGTPSGTFKKIAITIDGVTYYLQASTIST